MSPRTAQREEIRDYFLSNTNYRGIIAPGYFFMRDIKRPAQKSKPAEREINAESGGQREKPETEGVRVIPESMG